MAGSQHGSFSNPNVRFGTAIPIVLTTDRENDTYVQTSNGLNTGTLVASFVFDATSNTWVQQSASAASNDFWRSGSLTGVLPDGTTDVQDAIYRSGQTVIDTGVNGDSGFTLDDLRSRNSAQLTTGDIGVTDTNMTATGVDTLGKVRLANSLSVPDLRATNPAPQDYAAGNSYTFKTASAIGILPTQFPSVQTYVMLETQRRYASGTDFSGGQVFQRVTLDDGRKIYRTGTGATTWGAWQYETQVQTEFNLQDLLQLNGTAKVSLAGEVAWSNKFITMTAGSTPQEVSGYHDIFQPAVGATIPVQGGGTRTVIAPTAGQTAQSGGILLNNWETLWYRAVRGTNNTSVATNFLITAYTSNATTGTPAILNNTSYPSTHAGEWIRVVSRDDGNKFKWGTGDVVSLGGQFGGGHDLTIANWTAMKNRANLEGYAYATFASATLTRVGFTGTVRWIDAGANSFVNNQGYVDTNQAGRVGGTPIYGVNGAANRTWEILTPADAIEKFGGARTGSFPITATSTVVQLADNETLYYACNIDNTGVNTGTWYVAGYSGNMTIPVHWLPVMSYQVTGANSTTQWLVGGVQRSLRAGDAIWTGKADGDLDRLHRRIGVTHQGLKYTRLTSATFFSGTGANGLLRSANGIMVSWNANRMMYGISDGYTSWGNQYSYINVPAVGTQIPVATNNGAIAITRTVTSISGRAYIPLGAWESLWFIPPANSGGTSSTNGDFVIGYYGANHGMPVGAVRVAHVNSSGGNFTGVDKTRVHWADGVYTQGGVAYATATPVENDHAQGTGDWRAVTIAGQAAPGMTVPIPATVGVTASSIPNYRYNTIDSDPRGQIEIEGLISLNNNIAGISQTIGFMSGVQVRGLPIYMAMMNRTTSGDAQPIPVQLRFVNSTINGQTGVAIQVYGESGNTTNDYATLGPNGSAQAAGVPQWLSIGPLTLPHA